MEVVRAEGCRDFAQRRFITQAAMQHVRTQGAPSPRIPRTYAACSSTAAGLAYCANRMDRSVPGISTQTERPER